MMNGNDNDIKATVAAETREWGAASIGEALICCVVFIGILLSGAIYFGISSMMSADALCEEYYDGEKYDFSGIYAINEVFYKNSDMRERISKLDYLLFGNIDDDTLMVGKNGFLFEAYNEAYGYDYVKDYIGELAVDDTETDAMARAVRQRHRAYGTRGIEYLLVVIPNSQTVCADALPDYFGEISSDTRLKRLGKRLEELGESCFLDPTDALISAGSNGQLYNNTENSLNAAGAYYLYRAVAEALSDSATEGHNILVADELDIYTHTTDGRALARRAGLEKLVKNRTLALPSDSKKKYMSYGYLGDTELTYSLSEYRSEIPISPAVLIQFAEGGEWDKILLSEFFSNTFGEVGYRVASDLGEAALSNVSPGVVIEFIHENQLSLLLDEDINSTYTVASGLYAAVKGENNRQENYSQND